MTAEPRLLQDLVAERIQHDPRFASKPLREIMATRAGGRAVSAVLMAMKDEGVLKTILLTPPSEESL